jgi:IS5 family transposase
MMFKILVLQRIYIISDDQTEFQINDRMSSMRFLGLALGETVPDATFVDVPKQRNTREENKRVKAGEVPESWSENKRRQKDTDARWTKKNNEVHFGYKDHVKVDADSKTITDYAVTGANVHDSELWGLENVIITPHNFGAIPDYLDRAISLFIKSYGCFIRGESLPNLVDLKPKY